MTLEQFTQVVRAINHVGISNEYWGIVTYERMFDVGCIFRAKTDEELPAGTYLYVYLQGFDRGSFHFVTPFACIMCRCAHMRDMDVAIWRIG